MAIPALPERMAYMKPRTVNLTLMRNRFFSMMIIAAAAMSFAGCKDVTPDTAPERSHKVKFIAEREFTKTSYSISGNVVSYSWTENDQEEWDGTSSEAQKFHMFEGDKPATHISAVLKDGLMSIEATFEGPAPADATYSGYFNSGVAAGQVFRIEDGALVYDQGSDVLVAAPATIGPDGYIMFRFRRTVSFAQLMLHNLIHGSRVTGVMIESSDADIAGQYDSVSDTFINPSRSIGIQSESTISDNSATVVAVILPVESASIRLTVTTKDSDNKEYTYVKNLSKALTFTSGCVKGLNVDLTGCEIVSGPGPVDLGLSVLWATCNLGASNPYEYGGYYQWAGTQDVTDRTIKLDWDNCPYHEGKSYSTGWTKYGGRSTTAGTWSSSIPEEERIVKTVLDPEDDAAHVILGGNWRMPTIEECLELKEQCTWVWTDNYNETGIKGVIISGNKTGCTDRSIFIPAAGYRSADYVSDDKKEVVIWSSSILIEDASRAQSLEYLHLGWKEGIFRADISRYCGVNIRPVMDIIQE